MKTILFLLVFLGAFLVLDLVMFTRNAGEAGSFEESYRAQMGRQAGQTAVDFPEAGSPSLLCSWH